MFYSIRDKLNRYSFSVFCNKILQTAPLKETTEKPVAVLSQLQHKDLLLFLVAIKTFTKEINIKKVFIINDGSLTEDDLQILNQHIPFASIYDAKDFSHPACPTGGCWERLLAIAEFVSDYYIVQLDSDTLTLAPLEEVKNNIKNDTGFVIGTWDNQQIEPMLTCSTRVQKNQSPTSASHVQMYSESIFSQLEDVEKYNYVRGCAGFAGFPKNSFSKQFIIDFSNKLENKIGEKWHDWGSEQVMSNIVVANLKKSTVLPHPEYSDCLKMKHDVTKFIHFIGDCRFKNGTYRKLAKQKIQQLPHKKK